MFLNSFFPLTLIEWNQLDTDIRNSPSYYLLHISRTPQKVSVFGVILVLIFAHLD